MKAYLDSSVILRVVLSEAGALSAWSRIETAVTSELARVEVLRTLDRLRLAGELTDHEVAARRAAALRVLSGVDAIRVNRAVLDRAAEPFPTSLRTLDAIHLASALLARSRVPGLRFATHDEELATAAHAMGLAVVGV